MYSEPLGIIFFSMGFLTLVLYKFYIDRKNWYWFIIFSFASIYAGIKVKNVIVIENEKGYKKYSTFNSSYNYEFKNGEVKNLEIEHNTIINDSDYAVVVEKVFYSFNGGTTDENPTITTIYPYTNNNSFPQIDYIFTDPPQTISEKQGGGIKTTYWLHY